MTKEEKKWFADTEQAERYRQSIAGNPGYCTWPTYSEETPEPSDERE